MTSPPMRAANGTKVSSSPFNASRPRRTAPRAWIDNPSAEGRPILQVPFPFISLRTFAFGWSCHVLTPSSFLSHAYSASHFAGVILTYITIITI